ncbi:unnamed protein product [Gadus morhua 'NCC']
MSLFCRQECTDRQGPVEHHSDAALSNPSQASPGNAALPTAEGESVLLYVPPYEKFLTGLNLHFASPSLLQHESWINTPRVAAADTKAKAQHGLAIRSTPTTLHQPIRSQL